MENQVTVEKKVTKELVIKVAKIAGNAVFYVAILFLLLFSIMNIRGSKDTASYPNIFGRGMLAVVSDSMDGDKEDSFQVGDLLIVKVFKEKDFNDLEIGDVVTFFDPEAGNGEGGLNSHRIVHILKDSNGNYESIVVQGDKSVKDRNYTFNPLTTNEDEIRYNGQMVSSGEVDYLAADDILGVMIKVKEGAGNTLLSVRKNWFFIFVIPVLILLLVEIFIVVKNIMDLKNEKAKEELKKTNEELKADLEAQKEALRAEILAELNKEKENQKEAKEE